MKRRMLGLVVLAFFSISILAGCGSNTGNQETTMSTAAEAQTTASVATTAAPDYGDTGGVVLPIAKEKITVRALMNMAMSTPLADTFFIKEVEKRTNIQIVFENVNPTDPLEKYNLLVAANNLPDICGSLNETATVTQLGVVNFEPINKHLDIMPNFKKVLDSKPEIMKVCSAPDGNLYNLPYTMYLQEPTFNYGMLYRKDIFDKLGIPAPKGPDGYYDALKKLKQAYPKADLFVNYYKDGALANLSESWNTFCNFYQPDGKNEYVYGPITNEWKEFLAYYAKLYAEGLLDPEFFTASYEQFSAKALQPDNGFIFRAWFGTADTMSNQVKDTIQGYDLRAAFPVGPYGKNFKEAEFIKYYGIAVSAKSKYITEILQLWDYFFSPSGATLVSMGAEGETFNVDANGNITYVGFEGKNPSKLELTDKFGINIINVLVASDPRSVSFKLTDRFQEAIDLLRPAAETSKPQPVLKYSEENNTKLQAIMTDLNKIMMEYGIKVITGKDSLDNWGAYVKKLEKAGLKTAQEIQTEAFAKYIN